ncbi:MAG TPA: PIN domain nuclease [Cyanobacteria bacterium UBA11369]|nr:PIN domain nuclease [Cyanobacteria bacterium UBA11371]HBE17972.1 PIN domain nuclease [Cyanobacteria bacterium UBA11367]HBE30853.1 PIN domain nuclease [Cyanobacteria bacterium UBA11368]HBE51135.1 PIN domain nuclease [Cyanobacteria bacterium UBA11369]
MIYLVDTNVLLRFVDRSHPLHSPIRVAIRKLRRDGHQLQVTSQNCVEFWNVFTRPIERNGFGLTPANADRLLRLIERLFPVLPDSPAVYQEWRRLVVTFNVSGVKVHDARLVAVMKVNNISRILTLNAADFMRYVSEGIVAIEPGTVDGESI